MMNLSTITIEMRECLKAFFDNQLSPETRRAYQTDLKHFSQWTAGKPLNRINQSDLIRYREALLIAYSKATVIRRLAAVRGFFQHLVYSGVLSVNPSSGVKLPKKPNNATTEALTDTEVSTLLSTRLKNTPEGRFELALFSVLFFLGLRRSEVCNLKVSDIGTEKGIKTVRVTGKGGKERLLPIPNEVYQTLLNHLADSDDRKWLIVHPGGSQLNATRIYRTFIATCSSIGIHRRVSPHSARATFVSNALDADCNPVAVQAACGWSDMSQISRYDKRRNDIKKSVVWKVNYK